MNASYVISDPLLLIAGSILCLAGFVVYWFTLRAAGVYLGALAGGGAGMLVATVVGVPEWRLAMIGGLGLVGAAIGWWMVMKLSSLAFFLLGAVGGMGLGRLVAMMALQSSSPDLPLHYEGEFWLMVAGGGLFGGAMAYFGRNVLMVLLTAVAGSLLVNAAIEPFPPAWTFPVLAAASALWQGGGIRLFAGRKRRND